MDQKPPDGYQEIGETIAQAVAENVKGFSWATDLAKMLGYKTADVRRWLSYYREEHAAELLALERLQQRKARKIAKWKQLSEQLRRSQPNA